MIWGKGTNIWKVFTFEYIINIFYLKRTYLIFFIYQHNELIVPGLHEGDIKLLPSGKTLTSTIINKWTDGVVYYTLSPSFSKIYSEFYTFLKI